MKTFRTFLAVVVCALLGVPGAAFAIGVVTLGTAENFSLLSKTGVSASSSVQIVGNVGVSPALASTITGFALSDASAQFASSPLVNGKVYTSDSVAPTPTMLQTAVSDMETAYNDGRYRPFPASTDKGVGSIGGLSFTPGLYKWNTSVSMLSDITLQGGAEDVWIFQIAGGDLDIGANAKVVLSYGALAKNIFFVVAGKTTLGENSVVNGSILSQDTITFSSGAALNGKALSLSGVTLGVNSSIKPDATSVFTLPAVPVATTTPPVIVPPPPATATTTENQNDMLQAQINTLLATIQALTSQLKNQGISISPKKPAPIAISQKFSQDLFFGSKGVDVAALQTFLISRHIGPSTDALASIGATGNFGLLTKQALIEFQKSADITPASGYFGPKTRTYINAL